MAQENYLDDYDHLKGMVARLADELPVELSGVARLQQSDAAGGALNKKTKALLALGVAIAVRCYGCIPDHVHDVILAGANRNEILETIGVALLIGGGPSLTCGAEALAALDQFEEATVDPAQKYWTLPIMRE